MPQKSGLSAAIETNRPGPSLASSACGSAYGAPECGQRFVGRRIEREDAAVDIGQVEVAVEIEIGKHGAKPRAPPRGGQTRVDRAVLEQPGGTLPPKRVRFDVELGDEQVGEPVAIDVAPGRAHARARAAQAVERDAQQERLIFEGIVRAD